MNTLPSRPAWLKLVLLFVLGAYLISLVRLHPSNLFGFTGDDAIYFSSAQALAQGHGYILPNFPGHPPATKYPAGYPWLLSSVWRVNSSFPSNLRPAIAMNAAFACAFIVLMFLFFYDLHDLNAASVAVLTAFCALHPLLIFYSASLLTEIPFCAAALAALLIADKELRPDGKTLLVIVCGLLAGSSILLRVFGVTIVAGIFLSGLIRRAWRQTLIFSAAAIPFFIPLALQQFAPHVQKPVAFTSAGPGWDQTYTYFTNYLAFWKLCVPNSHIFWTMVKNNFITLLQTPADLLLYPLLSSEGIVAIAVVTVVAAITLSGMVRQAIRNGWKPIHLALLCYLPLVLLWNYPDSTHRFLLPFLPLIIAGFWTELAHLFKLTGRTLHARKSAGDKIVAIAFGCALIAFVACVLWNYFGGMRTLIHDKSAERASLLKSKREAYAWLAAHTSPDDSLIAYESATAYLYTGRSAMPPLEFTTAEFYQPERVDDAASHMPDAAKTIHASYWIFADDDFQPEFAEGVAAAQRELGHLETILPLSYVSSDGRVRVRSVACYSSPAQPNCKLPLDAAAPAKW